jgi:hypothetical protein
MLKTRTSLSLRIQQHELRDALCPARLALLGTEPLRPLSACSLPPCCSSQHLWARAVCSSSRRSYSIFQWSCWHYRGQPSGATPLSSTLSPTHMLCRYRRRWWPGEAASTQAIRLLAQDGRRECQHILMSANRKCSPLIFDSQAGF